MALSALALAIVLVATGDWSVDAQRLSRGYCDTLNPGYTDSKPQVLPLPFTISVSKDEYYAGDVLNVTLNATSNQKFRGFLIQARRADPSQNQYQAIGQFKLIPGTRIACTGVYGKGLTHEEDRDGWETEKSSLVLRWTAPTPSQGHIIFRVTIIVSSEVYWVGEVSKFIRDPKAPPMPLSTTEVPGPILQVISVEECGDSKGCYRNPPGCTSETCDMLVTWQDKGEYVDFEITGDSDGWVAIGFSEDKKMGKDDVTECVWDEDEAIVRILQSYNVEDIKTNVPLDDPSAGLHGAEGYNAHGRITCSFRRDKVVTGLSKKFDLAAKYHILMTRGKLKENGEKDIHVLEPGKYPYVTPVKVSTHQNIDITSTARYPLVKAHGILMILAWMLCGSTALIFAKYYKLMWPNDRLCGERVWFAVHRGLMINVLFLTIIGFILIFVHVGGYSWMPFLPEKAHPPLGIVVTILVVLNPLIALCRCSPKSANRPIFNWIHWFIGTVAAVLATPTLFIGLNLPKAHVPWWTTWVMVVWMLFHLIIELLLEIHGCINSRKQKLRDEEYELRRKNDTRGDLRGREPEPVGRRFKKRVIAIYLFVTIICALVMVIAIASG